MPILILKSSKLDFFAQKSKADQTFLRFSRKKEKRKVKKTKQNKTKTKKTKQNAPLIMKIEDK